MPCPLTTEMFLSLVFTAKFLQIFFQLFTTPLFPTIPQPASFQPLTVPIPQGSVLGILLCFYTFFKSTQAFLYSSYTFFKLKEL